MNRFALGAASGTPAADESVQIHPAGVRLDAYLLPGTSDLGFGALGEAPLGGFAEITTTPVQPAGEGRGPEVLLPPGETRYFSFHVAGRRPVGWGAAAGSERVGCTLMHGDGRPVVARPLVRPTGKRPIMTTRQNTAMARAKATSTRENPLLCFKRFMAGTELHSLKCRRFAMQGRLGWR